MAGWLSTMAMFYAITFLVLLPLHWQRPVGMVAWAQYLVSVFFQGVALPVLAFVAKQEGDRTTRLLQETHDATMKELGVLRQLHKGTRAELAELREVHEELRNLVGGLHDKVDGLAK
jgi:hypothetical protein